MTKFNEAKDRLITAAERVAGAYLLSKYGSAHLTGEPKIELTSKEGPTSSSFVFTGKITCFASDGLLNQVGVNMTINDNDIEVTSEDVQANITNALNAAENQPTLTPTVKASLDGFKLTDNGTIYMQVSHTDLSDAKLGVLGKNEYTMSKNKAELLKGIVKDAFLETTIEFTGEFKEPKIEKVVAEILPVVKKEASLTVEAAPQHKASSWLTAELLKDAGLDNIDYEPGHEVTDAEIASLKTVAVKEDMLRAHAADHLVQSAQAEEQSALEAQLKVEHEAANDLLAMLQGMGYGTAKVIEVTSAKDGLDIMTAIDHDGAVKAVSIPVAIKEAKAILPKKALLSTLIAKGLDVQAKLAEQFDLEVLEKLAAIEEKAAYEIKEAEDILNERTVTKEANEGKNTMFEGDTDTLTVQKHLLPNHEDMKVGDKVSDGSDSWEIVNQSGQQNSKGEGDSSLWTLKKVQAPQDDGKQPKNKIPN
ncbi:MAG: hypothetical protein ACREBR_04440 [bacterium]